MRLDLDEIARRADRAARADIEALVAALLARPAVRADLLAVAEEARLLEFADQRAELLRGERLLQRIVGRREIALRQLVHPQDGLARQIEHHVELLAARLIGAREVDRADRAAGVDAFAVRLAFVEVDLVVVADRAFRAGAHAGVAARAHLEVDRVFLLPLEVERAQPPFELRHAPGPHRIFALEWQFAG